MSSEAQLLSSLSDEQVFECAAERLGVPYQVDHFYMPVTKPADVISSGIDKRPLFDAESVFDARAIANFGRAIAPHFQADLKPHDEVKALGLGLGYGIVEAYLYNAVARAHAPKLIVEIGAGVSTWYAREATRDTDTRIICIEPYPAPGFERWCDENDVELWKLPLQQAAQKLEFTGPSLLFVDSTHVAKVTSELHIVFIDLMPRLPSGSLVHFHDIFTPYPTVHSGHNNFAVTANWYESTLLSIFLASNRDFETVFPQYWLGRTDRYRNIMEEALPIYRDTHWEGSSFWLRRK